jgi:hypothetical protein
MNESLQAVRDILHQIGVGGFFGFAVGYWSLMRMEKKLGRWFGRTNKRLRRQGAVLVTFGKTLPGAVAGFIDDEEAEDDE